MRLFLFVALLASVPAGAWAEPTLVGRATVVDGDTIEIKRERIRLNGIDAPEARQLCKDAQRKNYRCGAVAAQVLDEFLAASRPTRCRFVERDRYGRFVGDCYRADGASVAELLVLNGWAFDWPRYSKGEYADEQARARAMRLGLWAGSFTYPWDWRAERRGRPRGG
jgi:endonuclease YncB( thermonuclease family)